LLEFWRVLKVRCSDGGAGVEADCVEAIFNLGLVNMKLGMLSDAQQAYEKLHTIIPHSPEVGLLPQSFSITG
jgi:hypothetical protein